MRGLILKWFVGRLMVMRCAVLVFWLLFGTLLNQCSDSGDAVTLASEADASPVVRQLSACQTVTGRSCAKILETMEEEPLPVGLGVSAARFTFMPTFDDPWVFRINFSEPKLVIEVKCGNLIRGTASRVVENAEVLGELFRTVAAQQLGFEKPQGLDGDYWMLETSMDGAYHAVDRWSPDISHTGKRGLNDMVAFCEAMVQLSGFAGEITCWGSPRFNHLSENR